MIKIEDVAAVIKEIDCPEDKLKEKIINAYKGYQYNGGSEVIVARDEALDKDELQGYRTYVNEEGAPIIIAMVRQGIDHYVTTVEDTYILK
ncbi:hypothetical protein GOM49_13120 [Clostridium bovifaecis]|uniref:Uncharacterized protein n=1 Tax=Clostridium bovifaecis TaxID=2184719 RepID=A0A6I6EY69_9CLOT|nr:hypothetical protein GOM49_13120 [Clostridium bovifaecis]